MQREEKEIMPKGSTHWERLATVIAQANMTPNRFAHHIGLPSGENIYRIKRGQNGISRDVAERVVSKFPQISKGWLLTGEGPMYTDEKLQSSQIPFYDTNIEAALAEDAVAPSYYLYIPSLRECDLAIKYDKEPNTILFLKKTDIKELKAGKEYLFLVKKILYLHKWKSDLGIGLGSEDRVYAVKGRLSTVGE